LRKLDHSLNALISRVIWSEFEKSDRSVPVRFGNDIRYAKWVATSKAFDDLNDDISCHPANMHVRSSAFQRLTRPASINYNQGVGTEDVGEGGHDDLSCSLASRRGNR
jgi:hypothetical protein